MAKQLYQLSSIQQDFQARIDRKVSENKQATKDRVAGIPLLGTLLSPIAGFVFDLEQGHNQFKGDRGEEKVLNHILRALPDSWLICNNAVIEAKPDVFAQIDLLLIGPSGIFLIETKAWRGSFTAYRDEWKRREGRRWEACHSPTKQAQRHATLVKYWLAQHRDLHLPPELFSSIIPLVVFTNVEWLQAKSCSVPVFDGSRDLLSYLRGQASNSFSFEDITTLTNLFMHTPIPQPNLQPPSNQAPLCPRCAIPMVVRTTKQGQHQGKKFYGCAHYPDCRQMLPCHLH